MRSLVAVIATALASAAVSAPSDSPSSAPAALSYKTQIETLDGALFGIQSIDGEQRGFGQKLSTEVGAGRRLVRYTCPGATLEAASSELSYEFEAGRKYELVCKIDAQAEIHPSDC